MSRISKIKNNNFMEPHQNRLINLAFCWAIISSLTLLAQTMDICQCGPRCADYEEERLCARCCTSVMRRSIAFMEYPPDQLKSIKQDRTIPRITTDDRQLAQIVEQIATTTLDDQRKNKMKRKREEKRQPRRKRTTAGGLYEFWRLQTREMPLNENNRTKRLVLAKMAERIHQMKRRRTEESNKMNTQKTFTRNYNILSAAQQQR